MDPKDLEQLELLCQALYGGQPLQQNEAHEVLMPLLRDVQKIPLLRDILAQSANLQALLFAASGLVTVITNHWSHVSDAHKTELREFLLNYLYNRGPEMLKCAPEVLGQFIHLYCRIVKLGWLEEVSNHPVVQHVGQFLSASTQHWIIGLSIYSDLTQEMQPQMGKFVAKLRRGALNFKETVLPKIFSVTVQTLEQFNNGTAVVADSFEETRMLQQILQLCYNCLSFDFMATMPDDTSEEQSTVMIPQSWDILRSDKVPRTLFELYAKNSVVRPSCAVLCLRCLVVVAALRKSFFNTEAEDLCHINSFMMGTMDIIRNKTGLANEDCYHELCRLLGKINASNQLSQLLQSAVFPMWTEQLHNFTMEALANWQHMPNSKHYLLGVWAHMVVPLGYMRGKAPSVLETNILQITLEFIKSRLAMAEVVATAGDDLEFDNPLDDDILRMEQSDLFSRLCRCQYRTVCSRIIESFQELEKMPMTHNYMAIKQEKVAWLVMLAGAMLNGSSSLRLTGDESNITAVCLQTMNIELVGHVFLNMDASDSKLTECTKLEMSFLHFLTYFKKFFISEHTKGSISGDCRERFAQVPGCPPGTDGAQYLLNRLVDKVFFNLQRRVSNEGVIKKTLNFFSELSSGIDIVHYADRSPHLVVSARLILQCKTLRFALVNHADPGFMFLQVPQYGRYRTIYYSILCKLLLLELGSEEEQGDSVPKFEGFMEHHRLVIDQLWNLNAGVLSSPECRSTIIGLMRDLRGVCRSCISVEAYQMFFNWIVNAPKQPGKSRLHIMKRIVEACWSDCDVMVPLVKCLAEFLDNRGHRITFDKTSANGILLFKESAGIVMSYGVKLLQMAQAAGGVRQAGNDREAYKKIYKGAAACLQVLDHTLGGDYVNFGVFEVYGDATLDEVLQLAFQLCLVIPIEDLQAYSKAMHPVYSFLDISTKLFMPQMLSLSLENVVQLINACMDGLCSYESATSLSAASALDNFVTHVYNERNSTLTGGAPHPARVFLESKLECLHRAMVLIFNLLLSGDSNSAWSVSRPLLGLILLNQNEFTQLPRSLSVNMSEEKQAKLQRCFESLMNGLDTTLSHQNKDTFTKNVYIFSQEARLSFV
ncbi:EXPORTIN 7-RELATED / RAN BINDING domain containing PROTEIN [Babesia bigemina]|uniref:EXPORTIN 7-RELATED / RAN BINDING domain containing PROTEIN n=1 Tax=Babesia bigemina TaxID=5866 RepID=A0A061DBF0_BABBI|nr:EXPORTIN 7-RELATED / RAN BINDING domain containing PROTEIN [Babesia bigemina]CDR95070.1 EXPORTIN 7-RELATED / RAN BINDING domain containing PROTEIN [Babesia bigemina]|eukprot:XP_012767256.1 EXPORTIN 7-RELATED / RAN BINDING domain containing PROTEIN [Babesia bigemina]